MCDQHGRRYWRNAGGVTDALRLHFFKTLMMIRNLVNEQFALPPIFPTLNEVANTGLAGITRGEGLWVRQQRLDDFERDDFLSGRERDRQMRQKSQRAQDSEYIDVMIPKPHPEPDAVGINVFESECNSSCPFR